MHTRLNKFNRNLFAILSLSAVFALFGPVLAQYALIEPSIEARGWNYISTSRVGANATTTEFHNKWVNYLAADDAWRPIDTAFVESANGFMMDDAPFEVHLPNRSTGIATFHNNNLWNIFDKKRIEEPPMDMTIQALDVNDVSGFTEIGDLTLPQGLIKDVGYVIYRDAYADADLIYYIHYGAAPRLEKLIKFHNTPEPDIQGGDVASFRFKISYPTGDPTFSLFMADGNKKKWEKDDDEIIETEALPETQRKIESKDSQLTQRIIEDNQNNATTTSQSIGDQATSTESILDNDLIATTTLSTENNSDDLATSTESVLSGDDLIATTTPQIGDDTDDLSTTTPQITESPDDTSTSTTTTEIILNPDADAPTSTIPTFLLLAINDTDATTTDEFSAISSEIVDDEIDGVAGSDLIVEQIVDESATTTESQSDENIENEDQNQNENKQNNENAGNEKENKKDDDVTKILRRAKIQNRNGGAINVAASASSMRGIGFKEFMIWDSSEDIKSQNIAVDIHKTINANEYILTKYVPIDFFTGATMPVYTDTVTTFYPDPDTETTSVDGLIRHEELTSFATVRSASVAAGLITDTSPQGSTASSQVMFNPGYFRITRGFTLFDTSSIPDDDTVTAATYSLYTITKNTDDADAYDYIAVVTTSPASNTALVAEDYDQVGTTEQSNQIDIASISYSVYTDWTLNSTGRANISKTGISKFGTREGHDLTNNEPGVDTNYLFEWRAADYTGTTQDPTLTVTHSVVAASNTTPGPSWWGVVENFIESITHTALAKDL